MLVNSLVSRAPLYRNDFLERPDTKRPRLVELVSTIGHPKPAMFQTDVSRLVSRDFQLDRQAIPIGQSKAGTSPLLMGPLQLESGGSSKYL